MSELAIFNYEKKEMRTVTIDGEPWVVAKDVCDILELGNHRSSLALLDDDEKGVHTVDTLGGSQQVSIINEPGLYSLILRSRKPEAKAFKRWITHEVLPAIRKTGAYYANHHGRQANQRHDVKTLLEADQLLISAINAAKACGQDHNTAVNSANQSTIGVLGVDVLARLGIKVEKKPTPAQAKPKKQPKQFDGQQALFNYMCEIFKDAIIAANQEKRRATFPVMCNRRPVIRTFSNRDIFRIIETLADNGEIVIDRTRKSTCYRLNGDC